MGWQIHIKYFTRPIWTISNVTTEKSGSDASLQVLWVCFGFTALSFSLNNAVMWWRNRSFCSNSLWLLQFGFTKISQLKQNIFTNSLMWFPTVSTLFSEETECEVKSTVPPLNTQTLVHHGPCPPALNKCCSPFGLCWKYTCWCF